MLHAVELPLNEMPAPIKIETNGQKALFDDLQQHLTVFVDAYKSYDQASSNLRPFIKTGNINPEQAVEEVVNAWISNKCNEANALIPCKGHLKIERETLPDGLQYLKLRQRSNDWGRNLLPLLSASIWEAPILEVVCCALVAYDTDGLFSALEKAKQEIHENSRIDAATSLAFHFKLSSHYSKDSPLQIKQQKGQYILEAPTYGDHSSMWRTYQNLVGPAATFEIESGVSGFSSLFRELATTLLRTYNNLDSRTKFHAGEPVEAVFYKDKIKFHINPLTFEALISFIQQHYTEGLRQLEVA